MMKIIRTKDYDDLSEKVAELIADEIRSNENPVIGLATGSTPVGAYKKLIQWYNDGKLDFSKVTTVNLDEYKGLPRENEQSYWYFMHDNLFNHVNIRPDHINLPDGMNEDADAEISGIKRSIPIRSGLMGFIWHNPYIWLMRRSMRVSVRTRW